MFSFRNGLTAVRTSCHLSSLLYPVQSAPLTPRAVFSFRWGRASGLCSLPRRKKGLRSRSPALILTLLRRLRRFSLRSQRSCRSCCRSGRQAAAWRRRRCSRAPPGVLAGCCRRGRRSSCPLPCVFRSRHRSSSALRAGGPARPGWTQLPLQARSLDSVWVRRSGSVWVRRSGSVWARRSGSVWAQGSEPSRARFRQLSGLRCSSPATVLQSKWLSLMQSCGPR